jgi:hypothetical protein
MPYTIEMRKRSTGEVRSCKCDGEWDDNSEFYWLEGNASCDCNRHDYFQDFGRVQCDSTEYTDGFPCGDVEYTATKVILDNGTEIILEDESL